MVGCLGPINTNYPVIGPSGNNVGLILGHGHKHKVPLIPSFVPKSSTFKLVDRNINYEPDIVACYDKPDDINKLGIGQYDWTLSHYCPIFGSLKSFHEYIYHGRWFLNNKGKLIIKSNTFITHKFLHFDPYELEYIIKVFMRVVNMLAIHCGFADVRIVDDDYNDVSLALINDDYDTSDEDDTEAKFMAAKPVYMVLTV